MQQRSGRIVPCSVRWIAFGVCIVLTKCTIFRIGCQAFSLHKQVSIRALPSYSLRRGRLWEVDKCERTILCLYSNDDDENDDDNDEAPSLGLPALGPAGTSSNNVNRDDVNCMGDLLKASMAATVAMDDDTNGNTNEVTNFVNPKFALQYTCNVCETKNRVIVSRQAYREGMVIVVCKGCGNKHWIADNLDPTLSHSNIEEYFESRGLGDTVNRVTEEVYEIERVWGLKEGEITNESGDVVLE